MWEFSELPSTWKRQPDERQRLQAARELGLAPEAIQAYTAAELPDTSWGMPYYSWAIGVPRAIDDPGTDVLPVLLTSQADIRGLASAEERQNAMRETMAFLPHRQAATALQRNLCSTR